MESWIISLITGAIGGNAAGALLKKWSLGLLGNTIAGVLGGGMGSQIIGALLGGGANAGVVGNLAGSGIGGAVVMIIGGCRKQKLLRDIQSVLGAQSSVVPAAQVTGAARGLDGA